MARFDVTIVVIVQFTGDEEEDFFTRQIFKAVDSSSNVRYAFLCIDKDNSCKIEIYHSGSKQKEKQLKGKDFYSTHRKNGALPVFLRDYVITDGGEPVRSDRYIMFTIGHGAGFGIMTKGSVIKELHAINKMQNLAGIDSFRQELTSVQEDRSQLLSFLANSFKSNDYEFKQLSWRDFKRREKINEVMASTSSAVADEATGVPDMNYLTSFQFASIIKKEFSKAKEKYHLEYPDNTPFDLIVHINCYMQTLENGYALRKVTKYLAATEIGFPVYGLSYDILFKAIARNPDIHIETYFELIKTVFRDRRSTELTVTLGDHKDIAISLSKLGNYKLLYDQLSSVAKLLRQNFNTLFGGISLACYVYRIRDKGRFGDTDGAETSDRFAFLDMANVLQDFIRKIGNNLASDSAILQEINSLIKLALEVNIDPPFSSFDESSAFYPNSLGIFFPRRQRVLTEDEEALFQEMLQFYYEHEFSKDQLWDEFIKEYLDPQINLQTICLQGPLVDNVP